MRVGVRLPLSRVALVDVATLAAEVERSGLELVMVEADADRPQEPLAAASSCAAATDTLLVAARVPVTDRHPLYLAEERNVVDHLLGGRLVLALDDDGTPGRLDEWARILLHAAAPRSFEHRGVEYAVPAGLPQNTINPERRVRVTPAPFALEPTLWLGGAAAAETATRLGLSHLDTDPAGTQASEGWRRSEELLGAAVLRLRRPALRRWDVERETAVAFAKRLTAERDAWGLDTLLVELDQRPGSDGWRRGLDELARAVRPRLQQDVLPAGLEDFWANQAREQMNATTPMNPINTEATT